MTYQIDQSGKIEQTAQDTILAYANSTEYALRIPKKLKRKIQELFRVNGIGNQPKVHYAAYNVFINKKKPERILHLKEALQLIKKTDGRLRECLSTLVDAQTRSVKASYQKLTPKST